MNPFNSLKFVMVAGVVGLGLKANSALACAACFGNSDSPLAQGMNWGIFSLLAVVVCVLGCIASFFIFLARKSAATTSAAPAELPVGLVAEPRKA